MSSQSIRTNKQVRTFMMYEMLEEPIANYVARGDGVYCKPVFQTHVHPEEAVVDLSVNAFIRYISTAYGSIYQEEGFQIVQEMNADRQRKTTLRFRSSHPLFVDGVSDFQNACLISGLIYLGIPFAPYFDGNDVLV